MKSPYCKMPWSALTITARGQIKPCCQLKQNFGSLHDGVTIDQAIHSPEWTQLREMHLKGEIPQGCSSCEKREKLLGKSRRTWFEERFEKHIKKSDFTPEPTGEFIQVDLNLSNNCNLRCRMCGSWGSARWINEERALSKHRHLKRESNERLLTLFDLNKEQIDGVIPHLAHANRIDFKGGEPFLATHHDYVLKKLIEMGRNKDLMLHYTTNGTFINAELVSLLSKFKKVHLVFSIEATGNLYSYIRGGNYSLEHLEKNIRKYDELENVGISFNVATQIYNLLNLKDLWLYLHGLNLQRGNAHGAFSYTLVVDPPYLSPMIAPRTILDMAASRIEGIEELNHLREKMIVAKPEPELWKHFCHFTDLVDQSRGQNIFDCVPEFREYWIQN